MVIVITEIKIYIFLYRGWENIYKITRVSRFNPYNSPCRSIYHGLPTKGYLVLAAAKEYMP